MTRREGRKSHNAFSDDLFHKELAWTLNTIEIQVVLSSHNFLLLIVQISLLYQILWPILFLGQPHYFVQRVFQVEFPNE